ncbi:MAG: carboxypeptidase regulatory-like domain-containing protein, partial [Desulfuromonadaceae bacterium]
MSNRKLIVWIIVLLAILITAPVHAQLPQISTGLNYLTSSQNPDGTWATSSAETETTAATVSVLETLKLLNQSAGTPYTNGVSWLQAQTPLSVDYIAQRIHALGLADISLLIPSADLIKGGWGGDVGFETNPLDTAFALQTIKSANYTDLTTINPALAYLTGSQNSDGGWGFSSGDDSNVYMTAIVSATLQQFPQMTTIATAVSKATTYLLTQQNPDGGFGASTVYETALAYSAVVAVTTNQAALGSAINFLTSAQSANGSWNDDPYSTALSLKALYLSENKPSPPPPPPAGGKTTGTVIDKITGQKVTGVAVVLDSNQLINTTTDASGNFTLSDIPAGAQKVNFSLTGYAATSATATVVVNTTANLGNVPMTSSYSTGTIAGTITDSTGNPLPGVALTVSGAWSGSATTGADGTYSFTYVTPGTITTSATKAGYQTVTANGTVYARTTLTFSPRMSTTASQATAGTLVGRVVDSYWGVAIGHLPEETGVQVTVSGAAPLAVEPEGGGYFSIPDLAPGTYQVIVGMHGFASHAYRIVITPGGTTDLGTIRLEMSFLMTLTGKVTDASTGAPLSGAEVVIQGKDFTGRTDSFGTYAIADIPYPGEYTVKASATGYVGKSYTTSSLPWLQTLDIALSPQVTKGSLTGTVVDAITGQPLAGVTTTLMNDSSISATTDSTGIFALNAVPQGPQQVSLALDGYSTRALTTAIIAGAVNNVGKLSLATTPLPASIQGTVWDAVAKAPFANVTIQATGTDPVQNVTGEDGTYKLDAVTPGTVTVATTSLSKPGYANARFIGILEPGGILVFNPALTTLPPTAVTATVQTDKAAYIKGETANITANLKNQHAVDIHTLLHLGVTDPTGATAYETDTEQNLPADGTLDLNFTFASSADIKGGTYSILAEVYDTNGMMIGIATKKFGVTVSQISVSPVLPGA